MNDLSSKDKLNNVRDNIMSHAILHSWLQLYL